MLVKNVICTPFNEVDVANDSFSVIGRTSLDAKSCSIVDPIGAVKMI
jgi:hypothetical protein